MGLVKTQDEKEARQAKRQAEKEAKQARKEAQQADLQSRKEAEQAERERQNWLASPPGQASSAKENGQRYFQALLSVEEARRTTASILFHDMGRNSRKVISNEVGGVLEAIEDQGWELVHTAAAFRQTRQDSRDKFLASGQQVAIEGETVGVYLFKAVASPS